MIQEEFLEGEKKALKRAKSFLLDEQKQFEDQRKAKLSTREIILINEDGDSVEHLNVIFFDLTIVTTSDRII